MNNNKGIEQRDNRYVYKTPIEWEEVGKNILFNGIFLVGGGIFVILLARLFK